MTFTNRKPCLSALWAAAGAVALAAAVSGCGSDSSSSPDAATLLDGATLDGNTTPSDTLAGDAGLEADADGDALANCTGKPNGTSCGEGSICVGGSCLVSSCGDGFVNAAAGEDCEDGNQESGDGCTACRFDCQLDADCDDGNLCSGTETCDKSVAGKATCKAGTPAADATACTITGGGAGGCSKGSCVTAGCGDGTKNGTEECDDGNANDVDGCTRECKFSCKTDMECGDGDACNGVETCNMATHVCVAGTAVTCMVNGCAAPGTCSPATGMCSYVDTDKDGKACNEDCNDADPSIFPGAFECSDGKDNDCDAATKDVGAPTCECYLDWDKDGFAVNTTGAITSSGTCPDGYTRTKPTTPGDTDCGAFSASAFPGQKSYFATSYCPSFLCPGGVGFSFDYDCNKVEEKFDGTVAAATCAGGVGLKCEERSGWILAIPACGKSGTYRQCTLQRGIGCVGKDTPNTVQTCR